MSEDENQAVEIPAETVAAMRRQAGDNVNIQKGLGRIIEGMTEGKDVKGLERIRSLYGDEVFNKAVEVYRRLAV